MPSGPISSVSLDLISGERVISLTSAPRASAILFASSAEIRPLAIPEASCCAIEVDLNPPSRPLEVAFLTDSVIDFPASDVIYVSPNVSLPGSSLVIPATAS